MVRACQKSRLRARVQRKTLSNLLKPCKLIYLNPCLNSGAGFSDYPDGTVLLDTLILYGKISYKEEDVKIWERRWKPSERAVLDLQREWQSFPVANVQFIANADGGVNCIVRKVHGEQSPNNGFLSWLKSVIFNSKPITICTAACILGMVIFGIWRLSTWEQPGGAPDVKLPDTSRV